MAQDALYRELKVGDCILVPMIVRQVQHNQIHAESLRRVGKVRLNIFGDGHFLFRANEGDHQHRHELMQKDED